jgi:TRAP-type C4-dicarboxylate transport system substrate-binding protein
LTDVPLIYLAGGIVVKKEIFKAIPSSDQTLIIESLQHHLDQLKAVTRNENREAIKVMTKQGVKIITPSKDQIDEFKKLSNRAMEHITGKTFSKKVLEEVASSLENHRREGK